MDGASGEVVFSPNVGWHDTVPLAHLLSTTTGLDVVVENDANALSVYEYLFGNGADKAWSAAIIVSDGIGAGLILDGRIARGSRGMAGELGHVVVEPEGRACRCQRRGCLESVASIRAIYEMIVEGGGPDLQDIERVCDLAVQGDPLVVAVIDRAAAALGRGLAMVANLLNLGLIVLSGPAALYEAETMAANRYRSSVMAAMEASSFSTAFPSCKVIWTRLSEEQGARGAAAALLERFFLHPLSWRDDSRDLAST